jgi:hypothetical protein
VYLQEMFRKGAGIEATAIMGRKITLGEYPSSWGFLVDGSKYRC